jgi:Tol biopolymer transport system component
LLANNNYHLKAIGGNITELQYTISPSANANKMRLMFESGNITNAVLSVVDSAG